MCSRRHFVNTPEEYSDESLSKIFAKYSSDGKHCIICMKLGNVEYKYNW
jgi:hypothetical protein